MALTRRGDGWWAGANAVARGGAPMSHPRSRAGALPTVAGPSDGVTPGMSQRTPPQPPFSWIPRVCRHPPLVGVSRPPVRLCDLWAAWGDSDASALGKGDGDARVDPPDEVRSRPSGAPTNVRGSAAAARQCRGGGSGRQPPPRTRVREDDDGSVWCGWRCSHPMPGVRREALTYDRLNRFLKGGGVHDARRHGSRRGWRGRNRVVNDGGLLTKPLLMVENEPAGQTVAWVRKG